MTDDEDFDVLPRATNFANFSKFMLAFIEGPAVHLNPGMVKTAIFLPFPDVENPVLERPFFAGVGKCVDVSLKLCGHHGVEWHEIILPLARQIQHRSIIAKDQVSRPYGASDLRPVRR